ncbi:hypothetical protein JST99_03865 [Candidatus Dependentiae bacterium]|nr:hypothetical protein [Candidatus Dependentiae bacterium]
MNNEYKVKHPKTGQEGWLDHKGNVWVPTGTGPEAHGRPHWDVMSHDGKSHRNVLPSDKIREATMDTKPKNYLVCKRVKFYAQKDEDAFFCWIKAIPCIKSYEGAKDVLYLDLVDKPLDYVDMKDLIALLHRYKINISQLEPFINEDNAMAAEPWLKQIQAKKYL